MRGALKLRAQKVKPSPANEIYSHANHIILWGKEYGKSMTLLAFYMLEGPPPSMYRQ
jgi:hypothetical protein